MGEYFGNVKLGTCDDFRYVRYSELKREHHPKLNAYLKDTNTLYRFPWPHEDNQNIHMEDKINERSMFKTYTMNLPEVHRLLIEGGYIHKEMCLPIHAKGGGYQMNLFVPCPLSPSATYRHSPGSHPIDIIGERYNMTGEGRTIFACGYCDAYFNLKEEGIALVKIALLEEAKHREWNYGKPGGNGSWYAQIAERLKAAKE